MNKRTLLEIAVITAFLSIILLSLKLATAEQEQNNSKTLEDIGTWYNTKNESITQL